MIDSFKWEDESGIEHRRIIPEIPYTKTIMAFAPERAHKTDAGADLRTPERVVIHPHDRAVIDTGLSFQIPTGWYGRLESKSGLMAKGIVCAGGTIDSGYRGVIRVVMENHTGAPYVFERGDKIVQLVITEYLPCNFMETDELSESDRGEDGFGSTGR